MNATSSPATAEGLECGEITTRKNVRWSTRASVCEKEEEERKEEGMPKTEPET
jgi:hypothetical protein